jgi:hypothetical protein
MSPLEQLCRIFLLKNLELKGLRGPYGKVREANGNFGGGVGFGGLMNIIYKGVAMSQPHFEASVRMKLALPKVGTWSPPGLSKFQNLIVEVKTLHLEAFFIPLERS